MNHCRALFFPLLALLLSGCGNDGMVTATLITNLRSPTPFTNFMSKISSTEQFAVTAGQYCLQSQVYAIYGDKNITGGAIQKMTSIPVTLSTPLVDFTAFISGGSSPTLWLNSSTLQPVQFNVQKGTTVQFGIVGALYMTLNANSDGSCTTMNTSPALPNRTFSLMGHSETTLLENTTIPLNLWITNSQPPNSLGLPTASPSSNCSIATGANLNNIYTQQCPNLNFSEINIAHCPSNVQKCFSAQYAEIQYLKTLNSTHFITQLVTASYMGGPAGMGAPIGVILPNMDWYSATLVDGSGSSLETAQINLATIGPSPTPVFVASTGQQDSAYLYVSGIRTGPVLTVLPEQLSTGLIIPLTWTAMPGAVYYQVMGIPTPYTTSSGSITSVSLNVIANPPYIPAGNPSPLSVVAVDAAGIGYPGNTITVNPVGTLTLPVLATGTYFPTSASVDILFNGPMASGATNLKIEHGPPNTTNSGDFISPGSGVNDINISELIPISGGQSVYSVRGLQSLGSYYFRITAYNNQMGTVTALPGYPKSASP